MQRNKTGSVATRNVENWWKIFFIIVACITIETL